MKIFEDIYKIYTFECYIIFESFFSSINVILYTYTYIEHYRWTEKYNENILKVLFNSNKICSETNLISSYFLPHFSYVYLYFEIDLYNDLN